MRGKAFRTRTELLGNHRIIIKQEKNNYPTRTEGQSLKSIANIVSDWTRREIIVRKEANNCQRRNECELMKSK